MVAQDANGPKAHEEQKEDDGDDDPRDGARAELRVATLEGICDVTQLL